jgi:hypothetical protein
VELATSFVFVELKAEAHRVRDGARLPLARLGRTAEGKTERKTNRRSSVCAPTVPAVGTVFAKQNNKKNYVVRPGKLGDKSWR